MAKFVLTDPGVTVTPTSGTEKDVSAAFMSLTLEAAADTEESTTFGPTGWREYEGSLKNWTASLDFRQDFADNQIDEDLEGILGAKAVWKFWPDSNPANAVTPPTFPPTTADNPRRQGTAILTSYPIFSNSIGEVAGGSISLRGSGELTRATT